MDAQELPLKSPKLGLPVDSDDEKFVSGLSTVLVASIQEAKDRISQIEFIFCRQLYPNIQSKSKTLQKYYSARKSLEEQWKEKEGALLREIEKMRLENERVLEENRLMKAEETKVNERLEKELLAKQRRIEELEEGIRNKCEEIDEGLMLNKNLVELVQSKTSFIAEKDRNLKQIEEKTQQLISRVKILEAEVENLQDGLRRKNEELAEEMKIRETFHAKNVQLASEIGNSEKERRRLLARIDEIDEEAAGYRRKLKIKTQEIEEREELYKQLIKQIEAKSSELLENKKKLDVHEEERQLLLNKVKCLEEKISLPHKVKITVGETSDADLYQKVVKQVESIKIELQAEKRKRLQATDAFKRLKSQHNYLRQKMGLTSENMLPQNKSENESDLCKHKSPMTTPGVMLQDPNISSDTFNADKVKTEILEDDLGGLENKVPDTFVGACDLGKVKEEIFEDDRVAKSDPPPSRFHRVTKCRTGTKSVSISGSKRPASSWRETRSRQSRGGTDPHDDFLDTPLENVRANLNKASNEEALLEPAEKDIRIDNSDDDETQDVNAKSSPQSKQFPLASKKSFKYTEPVRKKAERENLKGVECKQCKKFYDAVLPGDGGKDPNGSKQNLRCEHLDGVSRHRYRYVPPMTPEGFWNIGFESEL